MTQFRRIVGLIAIIAILGLSGCAQERRGAPILLIQAFNTSASAAPQLAQFAGVGARVGRRLTPKFDRQTLLRFDSKTSEVSDGPATSSSEQLQRILIAGLAAKAKEDNTLTEKLWANLADRAGHSRKPVVVVVYTDGYSEGTTEAGHRSIRESARRLADNPRVAAVAVVGARGGTHEELRADLAALQERLGDRFVLMGDSGIDAAALSGLVEAARRQKGN